MKKTVIFDLSGTLVKMRPPTLLTNYSLLAKLAQSSNLGVITGAKKSETLNILNKLKIIKFFSFVITADDTGLRKPNPNLFPQKKIRAYIGDAKKDELFAMNANVPFFRVSKKCKINQIIRMLIYTYV